MCGPRKTIYTDQRLNIRVYTIRTQQLFRAADLQAVLQNDGLYEALRNYIGNDYEISGADLFFDRRLVTEFIQQHCGGRTC